MNRRLATALFALAFFRLVAAQEPPPPAGPPPPPRDDEQTTEAASRRETIRIYIVHQMREKLGLTDAQTLKVLDVMSAMDEIRPVHNRAMRQHMSRLQVMLDDPATTDAAFKEEVLSIRKEMADQEKRLREQEDRLLEIMTPRQQAQWLLLRRELMGRVGQEMRQGNQRAPGGPQGPYRKWGGH